MEEEEYYEWEEYMFDMGLNNQENSSYLPPKIFVWRQLRTRRMGMVMMTTSGVDCNFHFLVGITMATITRRMRSNIITSLLETMAEETASGGISTKVRMRFVEALTNMRIRTGG